MRASQQLLVLIGVVALVALGIACKGPITPEKYCAEQGADGWKTVEVRCLRRLAAGVCNDPKECRRFPGKRYIPDLDSSLDIRCEGDTGENHYTDFGTMDCVYVGR